MRNDTTLSDPSLAGPSRVSGAESGTGRFERPSIEEISLCCEISAYAPDGDDRPLF